MIVSHDMSFAEISDKVIDVSEFNKGICQCLSRIAQVT